MGDNCTGGRDGNESASTVSSAQSVSKASPPFCQTSVSSLKSAGGPRHDYTELGQGDATETDACDLTRVSTLSELYQLLPSPQPKHDLSNLPRDVADLIFELCNDDDDDDGQTLLDTLLKQKLHRYQRRTLAAMLQKENNSSSTVRGGVLCEEMGTGKTLECLALIVTTRGSIPAVPIADGRDTPVCMDLSQATLRNLCLRRSRLQMSTTGLSELEGLPESIVDDLWQSTPYYDVHATSHARSDLARGGAAVQQEGRLRRVWLSCATLVVVPTTLISHWTGEIAKHTRSLRTHTVDQQAQLPDSRALASCWDIVLMSFDRFAKEASASREATSASPLSTVRFKRLIVDEGNKLAGQSRIVDLAVRLNVENRWIVSGTPTEMLIATGSSDWSAVESSGTSCTPTSTETESAKTDAPSRTPSERIWSRSERKDIGERLYRLTVEFLRVPPYYDEQLLDYALPGLYFSKARWSEAILKPLFPARDEPPTREGLQALFDVLRQTMIRNRPADVARDRPLPPLHRHYLPVTFAEAERLTYNVIQALIAANAALSEREGEDYFFHPTNRVWLLQIITNLSLACFHFASPQRLSEVEAAIKLISLRLNEAKWSQNAELREALEVLKEAAASLDWRTESMDISYNLECCSSEVVNAWSASGLRSNTMTGLEAVALQQELLKVHRETTIAHNDSTEVEQYVVEELITRGLLRKMTPDSSLLLQSQGKPTLADLRPVITSKTADTPDGLAVTPSRLKRRSKHPTSTTETMHHLRASHRSTFMAGDNSRSYAAASPRSEGMARSDHSDETGSVHQEALAEEPARDAALRLASVQQCTSSKLWKLFEILNGAHVPTLIFSSLDNVLYEISCGLDCLFFGSRRYRHRIFTSGVKQPVLDQYVDKFKGGSLDVLLIKTDKGARGLDLHRATRVIFMEPENSPSIERQAIKRAWRQGQKQPVNVYYLYVARTFEEEIIRKAEQEAQHNDPLAVKPARHTAPVTDGGMAAMLRDPVMRDFVAQPRYIAAEEQEPSASFELGLFGPLTTDQPKWHAVESFPQGGGIAGSHDISKKEPVRDSGMSHMYDGGGQESKTQDGRPLGLSRSKESPQDNKLSDRLRQQPHAEIQLAYSKSMQGSQDQSTATKDGETSVSNGARPATSPHLAAIKRRASDESGSVEKQDTASRRRVRFL